MTSEIDRRIALRFAGVEHERTDLHAYQENALEFLIDTPFSALFVDIGLGKTILSLSLVAYLFERDLTDKVLVIAPLRVATDTWPSEIALWRHTAWMSYTVIRPDADDPRLVAARKLDGAGKGDRDWDRESLKTQGLDDTQIKRELGHMHETRARRAIMEHLARTPTSIHIINREQVEWLVEFWGNRWPYRTVIPDESSSFKDHKSRRFKALAKVRNTPGLITRLHCLTATPAAETYLPLFTQVYLLDRGKRLGKNITAFREQYFNFNRWTNKYELRPGGDVAILKAIADVCLVMKREDHLPRAQPTIIQRKVKLDQSQLKLIRQMERHFLITLSDGTEIEAKTAAILSSMLLQMASGSLYETLLIEDWDTGDLKRVKKVHHLHEHKIETLKEIAEEAQTQGEPLLVAYYFKSSLARLVKAFPRAVVMDKTGRCIKDWNAGKIPILLIHPQSAGHGLNLQYGGSMLIFFDLIYSLEYYLQTIGRIDRQGQKWPVIVQMLVAEGTRDELVAACLVAKEDAQEALFRILKRLIREIRNAKRVESY